MIEFFKQMYKAIGCMLFDRAFNIVDVGVIFYLIIPLSVVNSAWWLLAIIPVSFLSALGTLFFVDSGE